MSHRNQAGIAHLIPLIAVVFILVAVAGVYVVKNQPDKPLTSQSTIESPSLNQPIPADLLPVSKVRELTAVEKPDAVVSSVELDNEDGIFVYKVKLADGSVLRFNAKTGAISNKTDKVESENKATLPVGSQPSVNFDKAREVALARNPGGTIAKIELESEEGLLVYSVRFVDDARVDVSAANGSVVRFKPGSASPASSGGGSDDNAQDDDSSHGGSNNSGSSSSSDSSSGREGRGASSDDN